MHRSRTAPLTAVALLALVLPLAAGCSSSGSSATTTTTKAAGGGSTTTTTPALPATGSVDGYTMAVTSSPASGTLGHTVIRVTAVLTGTVKPATLTFQVSDQPAATTGKPATTQHVVVHGAGTYRMPVGFTPTAAGSWAATVTFTPQASGTSKLSVSGLPPTVGSQPPFPQLVTVVKAG